MIISNKEKEHKNPELHFGKVYRVISANKYFQGVVGLYFVCFVSFDGEKGIQMLLDNKVNTKYGINYRPALFVFNDVKYVEVDLMEVQQ